MKSDSGRRRQPARQHRHACSCTSTRKPIPTSATAWRCSSPVAASRAALHTKTHNGIGDVYLTIAEEVLKTPLGKDFPTAEEKMHELI